MVASRRPAFSRLMRFAALPRTCDGTILCQNEHRCKAQGEQRTPLRWDCVPYLCWCGRACYAQEWTQC
jgi:hypothetical protein